MAAERAIADPRTPARRAGRRRAPPAGGLPRARRPDRAGTTGSAPPLPRDLVTRGARQRRLPARVPLDASAGHVGPERRAARLADRAARAGPHAAGGVRRGRGPLRRGLELPGGDQPRGDRPRPDPGHVGGRRPGTDAVHPEHLGDLRPGRHQLGPRLDHRRGPVPRGPGLHRAGRASRGALPLQQLHRLRARGDPAGRGDGASPARLPRLLPLADLLPDQPGQHPAARGLPRRADPIPRRDGGWRRTLGRTDGVQSVPCRFTKSTMASASSGRHTIRSGSETSSWL